MGNMYKEGTKWARLALAVERSCSRAQDYANKYAGAPGNEKEGNMLGAEWGGVTVVGKDVDERSNGCKN